MTGLQDVQVQCQQSKTMTRMLRKQSATDIQGVH